MGGGRAEVQRGAVYGRSVRRSEGSRPLVGHRRADDDDVAGGQRGSGDPDRTTRWGSVRRPVRVPGLESREAERAARPSFGRGTRALSLAGGAPTSSSTASLRGRRHDSASTTRHCCVLNPRLITCSITGYGDHAPSRRAARLRRHWSRPGPGFLYDQKGRRGTAMEYIGGRPGPHPEFDAPEGLVRGADRPGPVFPRTPWPSIGATYFATLGIAAALRAREVSGEGQRVDDLAAAGRAGRRRASTGSESRIPTPPCTGCGPSIARSIEGLYECADGRWVHHWTVRPRWVLRLR